jgi:hypothetical protein
MAILTELRLMSGGEYEEIHIIVTYQFLGNGRDTLTQQ